MSEQMRDILVRAVFFAALVAVWGVEGMHGVGLFTLGALCAWACYGIRTGWWLGIDTRVDAALFEAFKHVRQRLGRSED